MRHRAGAYFSYIEWLLYFTHFRPLQIDYFLCDFTHCCRDHRQHCTEFGDIVAGVVPWKVWLAQIQASHHSSLNCEPVSCNGSECTNRPAELSHKYAHLALRQAFLVP